MAAFASATKVETLEQQVVNLQTSMDALSALFIELRNQVTPLSDQAVLETRVRAGVSGGSPAVRNGNTSNG
jgi:hypothetical protein